MRSKSPRQDTRALLRLPLLLPLPLALAGCESMFLYPWQRDWQLANTAYDQGRYADCAQYADIAANEYWHRSGPELKETIQTRRNRCLDRLGRYEGARCANGLAAPCSSADSLSKASAQASSKPGHGPASVGSPHPVPGTAPQVTGTAPQVTGTAAQASSTLSPTGEPATGAILPVVQSNPPPAVQPNQPGEASADQDRSAVVALTHAQAPSSVIQGIPVKQAPAAAAGPVDMTIALPGPADRNDTAHSDVDQPSVFQLAAQARTPRQAAALPRTDLRAERCLHLVVGPASAYGDARVTNTCAETVSFTYCYKGKGSMGFDCKRPPEGEGTDSLAPGQTHNLPDYNMRGNTGALMVACRGTLKEVSPDMNVRTGSGRRTGCY